MRLYKKLAGSAFCVSFLALTACGGGGDGNHVTGPTSEADMSAAVRSLPLAAGDTDCPAGGVLVETGIDENSNGLLDDSEVDKSQKVCNGVTGANGTNGANGFNALVALNQESPGAHCRYGGVRIDSGLDTNRNGVLDSGEITSTAYVCSGDSSPGWGVATMIELGANSNGKSLFPQITMDNNGNTIAVWNEWDGTHFNVLANRYEPGIGWGTVSPVETSPADAEYPQITVDGGGNAIAVWQQPDGAWANRYVPGTGWGTATQISISDSGYGGFPQIAVNGGGTAFAVWNQTYGARVNIWANRYTPGTGWGTATLIETDDTGNASSAQIAVDSNGNAFAVWRQSDGTRDNIWANHYVTNIGWGTATLIESDDAGNAGPPQVAMDGGGNAIVVWQQYDGTRTNIWTNRFAPGTGWDTAILIETDDAGDVGNPRIVVDNSGNATAIWEQFDGKRYDVWANRYVPGTGWGVAARIETENIGDAGSAQIAVDDNDNVIAIWRQLEGMKSSMWANRYVPGAGWGAPTLIEAHDTGEVVYPQIAMNSGGNATAIWEQIEDGYSNIWVNRYRVK